MFCWVGVRHLYRTGKDRSRQQLKLSILFCAGGGAGLRVVVWRLLFGCRGGGGFGDGFRFLLAQAPCRISRAPVYIRSGFVSCRLSIEGCFCWSCVLLLQTVGCFSRRRVLPQRVVTPTSGYYIYCVVCHILCTACSLYNYKSGNRSK